jgi:hypothetical protein
MAKYSLDLMAVQEVRWGKVGSEPADDYTFFYGNENYHHIEEDFFVHQEIRSAVKKVKFISDRMLHIPLRANSLILSF